MKILHLIPTLELGGAERQLSLLAPAQVLQGHEVHIAVRRLGPFLDQLRNSGVIVHVLSETTVPTLFISAARLTTKLRPHIIQSWLMPMDFIAFFSSRFLKTHWIISERTSAPQYRSWPIRSRIRVMIGKHADAIVANSALGAQFWLDHGIDATVIQNAVPTIPPPPEGTVRAPNKLLMVGRMTEEKSHITALTALARLKSELPNVELTIVGDGPLRPSLERFIADHGIAAQTKLAGKVDNWWQLLHETTLLMNLSTHEGQPNVVLEAAAAGCPVLLSDIPAHRGILDDNEATFVTPGSADHVAEKIISLVGPPRIALQMAAQASKKMSTKGISEMSRQYEIMYNSLI